MAKPLSLKTDAIVDVEVPAPRRADSLASGHDVANTGREAGTEVHSPLPRRGLRRWARSLLRLLGLATVITLVSQAAVFLHMEYVLRKAHHSPTRFMQNDMRLAALPETERRLKLELAHPAYEWMSIGSASRPALLVLLSREDQLFPTRSLPFDPQQFAERAWAWLTEDKDGDPSGSTIPQQVAKNLFTDGKKSALRKAIEADYALLLEARLSKREIFEYYINLIEFGPGVYGLCAASFYYFDKPPSHLTRWDMATLVGLMPSPKSYTIYPTSGTVIFARHHADEYVRLLKRSVDAPVLRRLVAVDPPGEATDCLRMPESLRDRLARTTDGHGNPLFRNDQWWWARVVCQYKNLELPPGLPVSRQELRRRAPHTPCAKLTR